MRLVGLQVAALALAVDGVRFQTGALIQRFELVRQGNVARRPVRGDVGAVLVLDAEEGPHAAAVDFRESDEEGADAAVLRVVGEDGVEDPAEPQAGVDDHDGVVGPFLPQGGHVAE